LNIQSKIALVKGERSIETVIKAIQLAEAPKFRDKPIIIKVNLISDKDWRSGATTDPILVEGLISYFKPINNNIIVADSDATMTNADKAAESSGIKLICDEFNVPFINLRKVKEKVKVKILNGEVLSKVTLPKIVFESYVISAAKLKTHTETLVTLGLKNMFGLIPEKFKAKYHFLGIGKVVVDVNSVKKPDFTVIDGFIGMEGDGPVNGQPIKMDLVIAGLDPVAVDAVGALVMGFNPNEIFHIKRASEKGLGSINNISIVGSNLNEVKRQFKPPKLLF
jgi:uncharacterized protein (DUF362 family)